MLADDNAVNQFDSRSSANAGDGIEAELAFLAGILDQAGDAEVPADELATIEILREEGAITAPRPRYQRRGPALTQVAAVGLATFPAALAPLPAMAATPLPPSLAIAMATRPPAPPPATPRPTTCSPSAAPCRMCAPAPRRAWRPTCPATR